MRSRIAFIAIGAIGILALVSSVSFARVPAAPPQLDECSPARVTHEPISQPHAGVASYYASRFHGRPTASGDRYDENELTAAHRTLPFGTRVRVTNVRNARTVIVRVTDRGPFAGGRIIDLSRQAARQLGILRRGTARVLLEPLNR